MQPLAHPTFVLFGGTFNPVHEGHVGLVRGLLRREEVNRVFVVPAERNPFKAGDELLPAPLRLAMLERAFSAVPGAAILDMELRRAAPSYSVETVLALRSQFPSARLLLAMGWDVFPGFPEWMNPGTILENAGLIVIARRGSPRPRGKAEALAGLPPQWRAGARLTKDGRISGGGRRTLVEFAELDLPRISSSEIRRGRSSRGVPAGARELLRAFWDERS